MKKNESHKLRYHSAAREIAYIAIAVSLITVCAWISIPVGTIPVTLQTFAVALVCALLGWKRGLAAVFVYILMGLIGIPVFSNFGATNALFGVTGGYIFGFLFLALIPALAKSMPVKNAWGRTVIFYASMILGAAVLYFFGTIWYVYMSGATLVQAFTVCVVPFIVPDLVKFAAAAFLAGRLEKYVN